MEDLSILRLLIGVIFIGYASYSDIRTRRVRNGVWIVLGLIGFIILAVDLSLRSDIGWGQYLIFISAGLLFYDVYIDRDPILDENGFHFVPMGLLIYGMAAIVLVLQGFLTYWDDRSLLMHLLTIPAMIILAHIFFQTGLLKGGADAKALMALAVLFPFYPDFLDFPLVATVSQTTEIMSILFPFSLVILMNSAILVIFVPLFFLAINAWRGNLELPQCMLGFKVNLKEFPKHAWLMERVEDGDVRIVLFPRREGNTDEDIKALLELGRERAWATPQLPFMVPMFLGTLVSFFIGNLVLAAIYAIT